MVWSGNLGAAAQIQRKTSVKIAQIRAKDGYSRRCGANRRLRSGRFGQERPGQGNDGQGPAIDSEGLPSKYNAACMYSLLGESDQAIALLEDWLNRADPQARRWIHFGADLASLRQHPRYQALEQLAS